MFVNMIFVHVEIFRANVYDGLIFLTEFKVTLSEYRLPSRYVKPTTRIELGFRQVRNSGPRVVIFGKLTCDN